ncbi:MAG: dihydrolipoyllysine-residue succinyltransferase [Rhodospirillaceae bacterium]|nr:dihydrolipoyllysine-residue succinyltransferase [Rhodospirillaceae bacterium]
MATEIKVPVLGESISEATVTTWLKSVGDSVAADEPILELETDKVTMEVNAPVSGTLTDIVADSGADVEVGALLGVIGEAAIGAVSASAPLPAPQSEPVSDAANIDDAAMPPSVRKLVDENGLDPSTIPATGKDGRLTKGDVLAFLNSLGAASPKATVETSARPTGEIVQIPSRPAGPREERIKMTRLRQRIAERLKDAQDTAAMLTTFNEVDMSAVMELRSQYRDTFEKAHGVRLGFMSFFVKSSIVALKELLAVNAEIDGDELVYKNHYDIGVAVGTENGLVVPVLRDADQMSFAGVERGIRELGLKARDGKLTMEEMMGGTFTITNGGIYGSMLSTPILNMPQSGILGMHNIVERPMAVNGEVVIKPMMYVALSYDHRIIDGREAVSFLVRVKECIEDPQRIMLDM